MKLVFDQIQGFLQCFAKNINFSLFSRFCGGCENTIYIWVHTRPLHALVTFFSSQGLWVLVLIARQQEMGEQMEMELRFAGEKRRLAFGPH